MNTNSEIPVENMLELYLNLESVLDSLAPEKIYSQEFTHGMDESLDDLKKGKTKKVNSLEDFTS